MTASNGEIIGFAFYFVLVALVITIIHRTLELFIDPIPAFLIAGAGAFFFLMAVRKHVMNFAYQISEA